MASRPAKKRKIAVPSIDEHGAGEVGSSGSSPSSIGSDVEASEIGEDNINGAAQPPSKSEQKTWTDPNGPISRSNGIQLNMAGATSNSNIFSLQVDELLTEIRPNQERMKARFAESLRSLREVIQNIPNRAPLPVAEAEKKLRKTAKVAIPFPGPRPGKEAKYSLEYVGPSNINVAGSFALRMGAKSKDPVSVDLAVTMPKEMFQEKDYLNYRYFHKRAYYIACIAAGIADTEDPLQTKFAYQNDNVLQPILIVQPREVKANGRTHGQYQIRIITAMAEDTFAADKLVPYKCNIRNQPSYHDPSKPTAMYNSTLRSEACVAAYLKLIHSATVQCEGFTDSCLLGRTWLRQRGFMTDVSNGGFGAFEWAAVCAALLQGGGSNGKPLLSHVYSDYQLFKAMLQFLAGKRFSRPVLWGSDDPEVQRSSAPVFYDGFRSLNLLYKMTSWSHQRLRNEAQSTLGMLNDTKFDHFGSTFILKTDESLLRFDVLLQLHHVAASSPTHDLRDRLYNVVSRSLGDRVELVSLSSPTTPYWPVRFASPSNGKTLDITVGILLDPDHARRALDHGPPAEDKEASIEFRDFWGEKAELRRFKDGSILESLVWSSDTKDGPVVRQILLYALERHLGKDVAKQLTIVGNQIDTLVPDQAQPAETTAPFQAFMEAFQSLERQLQDMEGLPLSLKQLSAADPQLRYTSIHAPGSIKTPIPANIVMQFEGSGRWPDDLAAVQQTKVAFLLKIGELVESTVDGLVAKVGIENENQHLLNKAFLDITYPTGHCFRIRIHHDREQVLLGRILKDKLSPPRLQEEAAQALASYKRTYTQSPRHTQAVRTLCTRFPYLSPSIRVFKKWCSAHLLSNHLDEELMELFVISVFVQPYPWEAPSSTTTGFLRTLHKLSRWDWQREPLIVDTNGNCTAEDVARMNMSFEAWRKIDPAMNSVVLFMASNLDPDGITWTQGKPLKVVAGRLSGLAKAAMKMVKEEGLGLDILKLFNSGLEGYDFVIYLKEKFAGGGSGRGLENSRFKNLQAQDVVDTDQIGYDPIRLFLKELEQANGSSIVFFHGGHGGLVIAGVWNPQTESRPFRLKLTYSSAPLPGPQNESGEERVTINKPAILNEIASLGGDMIKKIEVNRT